MSLSRHGALPSLVVVSLLLAACGGATAVPHAGAGSPTSRPLHTFGTTPRATDPRATDQRAHGFPAYSATARGRSVAVHDGVDGLVTRTVSASSGAPLVFLVLSRRSGWLRVQLPVRPNGTTGWLRDADVVVAGLPYRLDVRLAEHQLAVFTYGVRTHTYPIGVGTHETPTPGGTFYLKELLRPANPSGPYGPYAYGLSGFSNTLTSFAGGDGVIGIHGTNDPSAIGRDVSHGCIRLRNADITALTATLPLGTPVRILA